MNLRFSVKLCVLLILCSFGPSVSAQSTLNAQGSSSLVHNGQMSGISGESECVKKAELKRRFLAGMASRVDRSALMRASATGQLQTVRALLRRGVAVNQKNAIGMTPLMLAAGAGHIEVIKALLAAGANPNASGGIAHGPIFSVMTMGMTSSNKNRMDVMDALMAGGGEVNPPRDSPIAPLVYAVESCDLRMIQALLERGADVNWNRGAPIVAAVTNPEPEVEIVKVLLAAGADPNLPRVSVGDGEMTLLSYLTKMKSATGDQGKLGNTQEEIVRVLKNAGAKSLP